MHTLNPSVDSTRNTAAWSQFWNSIRPKLAASGHTRSTMLLHRQVLRQFSRFAYTGPGSVSEKTIKSYLYRLTANHASSSWTATNITVLRTAFDKLGGRSITKSLTTPRRPYRLPETLSVDQIRRILSAATTLRDQLLLGLTYGCGLKAGEVCALRWQDVDSDQKELLIPCKHSDTPRRIPLAPELMPILNEGKRRCTPDDYIFRGMREGKHLSTKMASLILKKCASSAGVEGAICMMTLRHSYALHCLEMGANIRQLQHWLGHEDVETTLIYQSLILPSNTRSPLNTHKSSTIAQRQESPPQAPILSSFQHPVSHFMPEPPVQVELPFAPVTPREVIAAFYSLLKMKIGRCFLALRSPTSARDRDEPGLSIRNAVRDPP